MSLLNQVDEVAGPWSAFAKALVTKGRLPASWRELVILRVTSRRHCAYALEGHRLIARHCGLSDERIDVALGSDGGELVGGVDGVLICATDELLGAGRVSEPTKNALLEFLDEAAIIELAMLVGQYVLVGMVCETFELRPENAECSDYEEDHGRVPLDILSASRSAD
ncbi:MAG: carboxymuconolactone decarboxylase family protein [Actinomycetota bacterium]|nr:carboxymuconolactone decarboxylase family protein [Actinomycetota bacterium]